MEFAPDLTHIALVLSLAFLGGMFLERLRLPALVGYILVGTIIGPSVLGIQGSTEEVKWLSELGILLLMFVLGLELDMRRFGSMLPKSLSIAIVQALLSVSVMVLLAVSLGWNLWFGILLGFMVALSSTAVAINVLRDIGAHETHTAKLATGVLIAQDILVVPMLLFVSAIGSGFDAEGLIRMLLSLSLIAISFYAIMRIRKHPTLAAKLEQFFMSDRRQTVIAGMALCFAAAALTGALGLSTAFGAFAVGLLIGNTGSIGATYRNAIEPIHDLLLMVFFISIGLLVDVNFILEHAFELSILLAAILILKTGMNVMIMHALGEPRYRAYTLGGALAQIGEFSFVLIGLGLSSGFVGHDDYQLAISLIALSLAVSPLWLEAMRRYLIRRNIYLAGNMPDPLHQ
jgi:CPA2 family monovalent cation:H+ antiporter-2